MKKASKKDIKLPKNVKLLKFNETENNEETIKDIMEYIKECNLEWYVSKSMYEMPFIITYYTDNREDRNHTKSYINIPELVNCLDNYYPKQGSIPVYNYDENNELIFDVTFGDVDFEDITYEDFEIILRNYIYCNVLPYDENKPCVILHDNN